MQRNAGSTLSMLVDRWETPRDESLRELASKVFAGRPDWMLRDF